MAVIKGRIRGGGRQLAAYLLSQDDNLEVRMLDLDGQSRFSERDFRNLLSDFSLNERLTKSSKGIYHAIYNPTEALASRLKDEQWLQAADIIGEELGFSRQRRAVVLQQNKAGRRHIHIAFERYDHERGRMIPIPHNYRKHDRARQKLEQLFDEQPTQRVNMRRVDMRKELTGLWAQTDTGAAFITAAKQQGYVIAKGHEKGQFVFVDSTGQSFKLSSHLKGVRVREINERFKGRKFISEKEAVAFVRNGLTATQRLEPTSRQAFLEGLSQARANKQNLKPRM
ncbi:MAG TPA: hypothetical protein VGE58_12875 [Daejeonella sp.]